MDDKAWPSDGILRDMEGRTSMIQLYGIIFYREVEVESFLLEPGLKQGSQMLQVSEPGPSGEESGGQGALDSTSGNPDRCLIKSSTTSSVSLEKAIRSMSSAEMTPDSTSRSQSIRRRQ